MLVPEYSSIVSSLPSVLMKNNVGYFFDTNNKTNVCMETKASKPEMGSQLVFTDKNKEIKRIMKNAPIVYLSRE